jgi:hypothetical protein
MPPLFYLFDAISTSLELRPGVEPVRPRAPSSGVIDIPVILKNEGKQIILGKYKTFHITPTVFIG